jgi:hypothetical protein
MAHAHGTHGRLLTEQGFEARDSSNRAPQLDPITDHHGNPGRIITPVLETPEAVHDEVGRAPLA